MRHLKDRLLNYLGRGVRTMDKGDRVTHRKVEEEKKRTIIDMDEMEGVGTDGEIKIWEPQDSPSEIQDGSECTSYIWQENLKSG